MKNLNSDIQASSRIISIINRSKEQYENIINDLENAYVVINEKFEIIDANIRFSTILNSYFFRQNVLSYFHQDSVPLLNGALSEILIQHKPVTIELKTINGRIFLFNISLVSVGRKEEGQIIKLLGTDITDLRESEGIISDVFRSVSLGLVFINNESKIMPGYSTFTSMILENFELDGSDVYEVLFYKNIKKLTPDEAQSFEDLRTIFGKDKSEFSTITFLAPKILEIPSKMKPGGKKVIQLTLEPIIEDDLVKRYMMILQDMTDILNLNPPKLNDDIAKMMKLIVDDFETLRSTLTDIDSLTSRIPLDIVGKLNEEYKGMFHTIKGMLRLMGLGYLGGLVHELESVIKDSQVDESVNYQEIWDQFLIDWKKAKKVFDIYNEKPGAGSENSANEYVSNVLGKLRNLPQDISANFFLSPAVAMSNIEFSGFDDVHRSLEGLLIKNIDKTSLDVDFNAQFIKINATSSSIQALKSALIHLLNNSFAHAFPGVEHACQVNIDTRIEDATIILDYKDNGAGVNVGKIRSKLISENPDQKSFVESLPDHEIAQYIFKSGLSTKDQADEMSGRGEGLSSAVLEIERLGGFLKLLEFTNGCHFQMKIPLIDGTLFSPTVIDLNIFKTSLELYFTNLSISHFENNGLFRVNYPHLFYKAMKLLDSKLSTKKNISIRWEKVESQFDNEEYSEIRYLLSYNNVYFEVNENEIYLYIPELLSVQQSEVFTKLKNLQINFIQHLKNKSVHFSENLGG